MAQDYPVLFRSLYVRAMNWVDYTMELLSRFGADWERIRTGLFPESDPGRLTAIAAGAGDTHRQGRTVAILQFSSGLKLVYKPRSMSLDVHFAEFLEWVNQSGFEPRFRALKVIDCRGYGWSEFVDHKPCSSRQEVARFYERLGGYLAIFHALRGNDMHFENLIAAGEFPVPVDIETLFHPVVNQGIDPAFHAWQSSVLSVLMLPTRVLGSDKHDGVDISGLGGRTGSIIRRER
jgi:type 2 lantibiotic biosynthesis protein LanM